MDPKEYKGTEWAELLRRMEPRQVRNALRRSYRAVGKEVRGEALASLHASGLKVRGDASDWDKGLRTRLYPRGGGFMLTLRGRGSMHTNRRGQRLPILRWAEEGTSWRVTRGGGRHGVRYTGRMRLYGFLAKPESRLYAVVESRIGKELLAQLDKAARQCGFI